ncbi:MAG: zinc ribbon domain-containing protein, partial [Erysipelotrichaceae bacterium]|nr:zinc ribbon domain-containing protein [Erysipelotrichaceae bacterium]
GVEVSNSIPRIIEDDLFLEVQEKLTMNKKSPGRARAKNEYLLTTKLFCGNCGAMMTGISGTSMTGKKHQYYVCNNAKVKKCDKHSIKKEFIENEVIDQCRMLLTDRNIDLISREVVKLVDKEEKENSVLKTLNRQLNENQKAMDNLLRAIENGQAVDLITERLQDKKYERENLHRQIELENRSIRKITIPEIKFFLNQLRNGDINELKYRRSLISIFVSSIHLYDDKIKMIFSIDGNKSKGVNPDIGVDYLNDSSSVECVAPPNEKQTAEKRFCLAL